MKIEKDAVSFALGRSSYWRVYEGAELGAVYFRLLPDFTIKLHKFYSHESIPQDIDMLCVNITDIMEKWVSGSIPKKNAALLITERAQEFYDRMLSIRIAWLQGFAMSLHGHYRV